MAEKTLREFSVPSTDNVATCPNINMVQASSFCGKPNEDANAHLQNFLELCETIVKLHLFPFSLLGKAK